MCYPPTLLPALLPQSNEWQIHSTVWNFKHVPLKHPTTPTLPGWCWLTVGYGCGSPSSNFETMMLWFPSAACPAWFLLIRWPWFIRYVYNPSFYIFMVSPTTRVQAWSCCDWIAGLKNKQLSKAKLLTYLNLRSSFAIQNFPTLCCGLMLESVREHSLW